jgi:3-deoxy-D-manno-octulosonic-acid transferase
VRYLYSFLFYLALPIIFIRLWWRSRRLPEYRQRLGERLGHYPFKLDQCIWVHAVSVGETLAAIPLIKALKSRYPHLPLLVTTMTPTGAARVKSALGESVIHTYIPYDFPGAVRRFLSAMQPMVGIIMETELWPNLLAACHHKTIPVCLVNARLSEKSARGYRRIASLTREMLQKMTVIAAHGEVDAKRFIALGAPKDRVIVTGNIKFDLELPLDLISKSTALRDVLGKERFIWIAASTHEGEEEMVLSAHKKLREKNPQALLILVPRHPDRFNKIAALCEQSFVTVRRSQQPVCTQETAVYLGDTMGELLLMYSASDIAFVAGSLIPRGGHNMLEAGALGKPILTGPHLFNFAEISELFIRARALTKVRDTESLAMQLTQLMQNPFEREQMGQRALQVVDANRGALAKQLEIIKRTVESQR